jgi:hypothetical protein
VDGVLVEEEKLFHEPALELARRLLERGLQQTTHPVRKESLAY